MRSHRYFHQTRFRSQPRNIKFYSELTERTSKTFSNSKNFAICTDLQLVPTKSSKITSSETKIDAPAISKQLDKIFEIPQRERSFFFVVFLKVEVSSKRTLLESLL